MDDLQRKLIDAEAEARCLALVRRGASAKAVADHLTAEGYSVDVRGVRKIVKQRLSSLTQESQLTVEELRAHENERLDDAVRKLYPLMEDGNIKAINLFLKVSERRAKLNGLDAPTRVAVDATDALAALGINRDLVERATDAFLHSHTPPQITDAEVVDEAQAPSQQGQEEGLPRALESGGEAGWPQEPPEALSDAGPQVEAQPEIPADLQALATKGPLEVEGGAYFQRARQRKIREEEGPQDEVHPQATVIAP
jgi:hypothetical protein